MSKMRRTIRAIVFHDASTFHENGWWVAQCLEYDIAAQALTFPKLIVELHRLLYAEALICKREHIKPFNKMKAPAVFWKLFNQHGKSVQFGSDPREYNKLARPKLTEVRVCKRKAKP